MPGTEKASVWIWSARERPEHQSGQPIAQFVPEKMAPFLVRAINSHHTLAARVDALAAELRDLADRAENFAHSHAMIANGMGHVEGTELRYSVDRARFTLAALDAARAGTPSAISGDRHA